MDTATNLDHSREEIATTSPPSPPSPPNPGIPDPSQSQSHQADEEPQPSISADVLNALEETSTSTCPSPSTRSVPATTMKNPEIVQTNEHSLFQPSLNGGDINSKAQTQATFSDDGHRTNPLHVANTPTAPSIATNHEPGLHEHGLHEHGLHEHKPHQQQEHHQQQQQQPHQHQHQHLAVEEKTNSSLPTITATETSCTTAFPSLPPCPNEAVLNKRPTRDRVLRTLSNALMRKSLTMIDLSQRDLRPTDATLVKLALLQNSSLSVLKLGYNNLSDEGVTTLASGISTHAALTSLDLGFNNIGDKGCTALSSAILSTSRRGGKLHTLYLAGNSIGEEGARALAQVLRCGCGLKRIHLTRNCIGPDGIKELMEAVVDYEVRIPREGSCSSHEMFQRNGSTIQKQTHEGLTELFLGGTDMGHNGCVAVAKMLEQTTTLKVLSLANCELNDREGAILAAAITKNCKRLPLEKLQLSFNNFTCRGIETLMNAVWGLANLKDLQLDNNQMQARGAQVIAAVLGAVKTLTTLNVGFNSISGSGIKVLMKAVAESKTLTSLTMSGNTIDASSANAVAIALAHNKSLKCLFVDHCNIPSDGQRLMTAGIVSNSSTRLQVMTGFRIGLYAKILRLPEPLERWTNEQVLSFIQLMWKQLREEEEGKKQCNNDSLPNGNGIEQPKLTTKNGPVDARTVVAVAKKAFEALGPDGEENLTKTSAQSKFSSFESPLAGDVIVVESDRAAVPLDHPDSSHCGYEDNNLMEGSQPPIPGELLLPKSISKMPTLDLSTRKKKIMEWLCNNMFHLNELSNLPFNDGELWRLHQHFVSPTIQVTNLHCNGGDSSALDESIDGWNSMSSSANPCSSILSEPCAPPQSSDFSATPASEPVIGNLSMLKRKNSYRYLHEAAMIQNPMSRRPDLAVSKLIEDMNGHSMQPKSKRARRNRSRISIVPRIKKKLDSFLVSDHHRALGLMRQLAYVEKSLLNGSIYPVEEDLGTATHLIGSLASDAEMILVDMM